MSLTETVLNFSFLFTAKPAKETTKTALAVCFMPVTFCKKLIYASHQALMPAAGLAPKLLQQLIKVNKMKISYANNIHKNIFNLK